MGQAPTAPTIPAFRQDGYLPEGVHVSSEAEVVFRFGSSNRTRRRLVMRLRRWLDLAREMGAKRMLVDGSFVTAVEQPHDVDTVVLLPQDFTWRLEQEQGAAMELEQMLLTRRPEEIFAAEDEGDWDEWVKFFSQTREADKRRKGLVEVRL
jgi:hypothetical protein